MGFQKKSQVSRPAFGGTTQVARTPRGSVEGVCFPLERDAIYGKVNTHGKPA